VYGCSCCSNSGKFNSKFVKIGLAVLRLKSWLLLRQTNHFMLVYFVYDVGRTSNYLLTQQPAVFPNVYSLTSCVIRCPLSDVVLLMKVEFNYRINMLHTSSHFLSSKLLIKCAAATSSLTEPPIYITGTLWRRKTLCFAPQTSIAFIFLSSLQKKEGEYTGWSKSLCSPDDYNTESYK
jgi:hypothetical protein